MRRTVLTLLNLSKTRSVTSIRIDSLAAGQAGLKFGPLVPVGHPVAFQHKFKRASKLF